MGMAGLWIWSRLFRETAILKKWSNILLNLLNNVRAVRRINIAHINNMGNHKLLKNLNENGNLLP